MVTSEKTGWHKIGETNVDFQKDRDEVSVIGADRFASLKFKMKDAPIDLMDVKVYYEDGDVQSVNVNSAIKMNGESRVIDLKGGERSIKKIAFVYKTKPNIKDKKGHLVIYGLKTNTDKN